MSAHTPGPWEIVWPGSAEKCQCAQIMTKTADLVITVDKRRRFEDPLPDARLIAAAPKLLAVCERALKELRDGEPTIGLEEDLAAAVKAANS